VVAAKDPAACVILLHSCASSSGGNPNKGINPKRQFVSRQGRDLVAWFNNTGDKVTITFKDTFWPFDVPKQAIEVQPYSLSGWFRVSQTADKKDHDYDTSPSLVCTSDEPGEPAIVPAD
jgi:hypothetical protein